MWIDDETMDEVHTRVAAAADVDALAVVGRLIADHLKFAHFSVTARFPSGAAGQSPQVVISGLPEAWVRRYDEANFAAIDPVPLKAMSAPNAFGWDELDWSTPPGVACMRAEAYRHGLEYGFTLPMFGPQRSMGHACFIRERDPLPLDERGRRHLFAWANSLVQPVFNRLVEIVHGQLGYNPDGLLSPRQRQFLMLAARGLRSKQIASELDVCERTVQYMSKAVVEKFGCATVREALAKAAVAGAFDRDGFPNRIQDSYMYVSALPTPERGVVAA